MNIINPNLDSNSISILPRKNYIYNGLSVVLTNEDTNRVSDLTATLVRYVGNELVLDIDTIGFKEGQRYMFKVKQSDAPTGLFTERVLNNEGTVESTECIAEKLDATDEVIFKGIIFATSQDDINYTINNDEFTIDKDTDSNEMKVYE